MAVAAVTGNHGNASYALQLMEENKMSDDVEEKTRDEDADMKETELDEETRKRLEAEIEDLIIPDTGEELRKMQGGGEDAEDEEAADADSSTAAEGIITGHAGDVTLSFV